MSSHPADHGPGSTDRPGTQPMRAPAGARSSGGVVPFSVDCDAAYSYLVNPANRPEWQSSLRAVEALDDGPVRRGMRWHDVTWPGLRPLMVLSDHAPAVRWTEQGWWRSVRAELTLDFEPYGDGCLVRFSFVVWASGAWAPLGPVLTRLALRPVARDLRRAAEILEGRPLPGAKQRQDDEAWCKIRRTLCRRPADHALTGDPMTDASQSAPVRPFTRQSTVLELSSTLPGRAFKAMVVRGLPPVATEKERQELEDMTVGFPLETLVELSEGKLTWGIADSVVDLANRKPHRVLGRAFSAGAGALKKVTGAIRR